MTFLFTALSLTTLVALAHGFGSFREDIPNGKTVGHPCKPNMFWKGVGHYNPNGGGSRNQFGMDFFNSGKMWTRELCLKDSDGDGQTNGQELGDPNCTWVKGQIPSRTIDITHPGVCTPYDSAQCLEQNKDLDCSYEEFKCPAINSPDVQNYTMKFPKTAVPAQETTYMCMVFDVPADTDYHMIAHEPLIDNDNVMHHILIYACEDTGQEVPTGPYKCNMGAGYGCSNMIGGWTVGFGGYCLNENMGMPFGANGAKRYALEYHWNNPKLETNYEDGTGLTMYYTSKLRQNNGAVLTTGQMSLQIPPGRESVVFTSTCTSECTNAALEAPIYITEANNHMHYLGYSQAIEHRRNGTSLGYITNEPDYSYDDPAFYVFDPPRQILPGDELITTCKFQSRYTKNWVYYGDGTADEMCFGFMTFYPAEAMPEDYCLSWRSINLCANRKKPLVVDGCKPFDFAYAQDEVAVPLMEDVTKYCHLEGGCTEECKHAILAMRVHPCMRGGDVTAYVLTLFQRSKEGLEFLRRLDKCNGDHGVVFPSSGSRHGIGSGLLFLCAIVKFFI